MKPLFFMLVLASGAPAQAPEPKLSTADVEFFNGKVLPLLKEHCFSCHSHEAKKSRGGLVLDSREGLLKGGSSGPALVPGQPNRSLLIKVVRHTDPDFAMPPEEKLPADKIALLEEWVKRGAPDPRGLKKTVSAYDVIWANARTHWAFQPVKEPALPKVSDPGWVRTPVDAFLLAAQDAKGIKPSAPADKRTLIRRVTYDLTGLPPTPEEVDAFLADESERAYDKVVDRLLDSPRYGERWARHWMDVARYSDTFGERAVRNRDNRFPYAYTYRDYLIRAFNQDKPYDRLILEQLAADRLDLKDQRDLAALGFLTVGKRFQNPDDILDDRIDVVSRGLLGMSVTCARCHDHKFDPIPTKDYYSLFGVFSSSIEPEELPVIESSPAGADLEDYRKKLAAAEEQVDAYTEQKWTELESKLRARSADYMLAVAEFRRTDGGGLSPNVFYRQKELSTNVARRWTQLLSMRKYAGVFEPWLAFANLKPEEFMARAGELARQAAARPGVNPLVAKLFVGPAPKNLDEVARRYGQLFQQIDASWQTARKANPKLEALPDANEEAVRTVLYGADAAANRQALNFQAEVGLRETGVLNQMIRKVNDVKMYHPAAPVRAMALFDSPTPRDSVVFIRGERNQRGPLAPRQFLEVLAGSERKPFRDGSGRLELAKSIADPKNPLTARVLVNRLWHWHFGQGIVTTPSDFGLRSEPPSHPELLDWLAAEFVQNGWSIKHMHRVIVRSNAYRQRSDLNPRYQELDPTNALLWRMNRHRLDFEALRDSILAVTRSLEEQMGGRPVDATAANSNRRTVYAQVDRLELPALFTTFDFANPEMSAPQRFQTTVPQQALFLMNSPFVIEHTRRLVGEPAFASLPSDEKRVERLHQLLFQRKPSADDLADGLRFVQEQASAADTQAEPVWQYGLGAYDAKAKQLRRFNPMRFERGEWKLRVPMSDAEAKLSATGGVTGNLPNLAAIRRWVSPIDGTIDVAAVLAPTDKDTEAGVLGRIVSSRSGQLGEWRTSSGKKETNLSGVKVARGETIDFLVTPLGTRAQGFTWAPMLKHTDFTSREINADHEWSASEDFAGPPPPSPKGLSAWEKYAQVLLLTNEFVYVN